MKFALHWLMRALLVAAIAGSVLLSSCSSAIIRSSVAKQVGAVGCDGAQAAYYLPKRLLRIAVVDGKLTISEPEVDKAKAGAAPSKAVADKAFGPFCLEYVRSAFAVDKVKVDIDPETSLLQSITFNVDDKTVDVAVSMIDAMGDLAAFIVSERSREGKEPPVNNAGPFFVDPFDISTMTQVNRTLAESGFCVFLDGLRDSIVPAASNAMCKHTGYPQVEAAPGGVEALLKVDPRSYQGDGVLYRPLLDHKIVVMRQSAGKWEIGETRHFKLPNAAPAFLLTIDRASIGDSRASISFEHGTPMEISFSKQAELVGSLSIVGAAVQESFNIRRNAAAYSQQAIEDEIELNRAKARVLQAWAQLNDRVIEDTATRNGVTLPNARSTSSAAGSPVLAAIEACKSDMTIAGSEACKELVEGEF